jgi:hypothetical protein
VYFNASVCLEALADDLKFWQIQRDQNPLWLFVLSLLATRYGLLMEHGLSSR